MIACLLIENLHDHTKDIKEILADEVPALKCVIGKDCIYINLNVSQMTDEAEDFIRHLHSELKGICPEIRTGIASSTFASYAAAQNASPDDVRVVSSGETQAFVANQSVSLLPLDEEMHRRLDKLGLCKLGQLANIKKADLIRQFAKQGVTMSESSKGVDPSPPVFDSPPITDDITAQQLTVWEDETKLSGYSKPISILSKTVGDMKLPEAVRRGNSWVYFDSVVDVWKLEGDWWTESPQHQIYFKLCVSGREVTVSHDLARGEWRLCR